MLIPEIPNKLSLNLSPTTEEKNLTELDPRLRVNDIFYLIERAWNSLCDLSRRVGQVEEIISESSASVIDRTRNGIKTVVEGEGEIVFLNPMDTSAYSARLFLFDVEKSPRNAVPLVKSNNKFTFYAAAAGTMEWETKPYTQIEA